MKKYFCTLFDSNYLIKGLTMIKSLKDNCKDFKIFVLCMDQQTKLFLEKVKISQIKCIGINELKNKELLEAKANRTNAEFCWTMASFFTWYVMKRYKEINLITYLDADLLFFSSVDPIFDEIGNSSIAIIEHRFAPPFQYLEINGRFCVEWNSFRRDVEGLECLNNWKKQCLEWCYSRVEDGKMGDQKYLDEWPKKYSSCHIIREVGAGIAPWNYSKYYIDGNHPNIKVDGANLIFYHFHQFQILRYDKFFRLGEMYTHQKKIPDAIYKRYEDQILNALNKIRSIDKYFNSGIEKNRNFLREKIKLVLPNFIKKFIRSFI